MKVTIAGVSKYFGQVRALHDVNLEIADGELFFLLGPSGCGKTTLLRCIGGFESVSGGQIMLNGEDVASRPANERNTAMVFQGYALWPHMTVAENVAFGLEMRKVPKDERERRVREALQRVQIEHLRQRKPNELSGGQQQRVALARTLVVEPGCLLLDEPLANLDAKLRRDMRREIRRLCKDSGLTGIYVTHDRQEALSMADRVAVLKDGVVEQVATPQELYRRPASAFIANFIGETNFVSGKIKERSAAGVVVETPCGLIRSSLSPEWAREGQDVLLSLRPEALSLGAGGDNTVSAVLRESTYLGEIANHVAEAAGGVELSFCELNPVSGGRAGEQVTLSVRANDVVVLPPSDER
ncbi:MAG: ABC transporter ATP-binding protein [Lentisphaeria bacterium]|nr:ABC transporter ATP-binding protein [Lentisphaeria bacterium]